jgi:phage-related protein
VSEKWGLVSDWFSEKWGAISTWVDENVIQPVKAVIDPIVEWIGTAFEGAWIIVKAAWMIVSEWFDTNVIQPVVANFNFCKEKVVNFLTEAWNRVKGVWNVVSGWFRTNIIDPVVKNFNYCKGKVIDFFTEAWNRVKSVWNVVSEWFSNNIIEPVRKNFEFLGEQIREAFSYSWNFIKLMGRDVVNGLIGMVESGINSVVSVVNELIGLFNGVVEAAARITGSSWEGLSTWNYVHLGRVDWGDENYARTARGIGGSDDAMANQYGTGAYAGRGEAQEINITVELDGEKVGQSTVNYVNEQTWANGRSPLLAY